MTTLKFQIHQFKPEKMVKHPAIILIAKRGSGKSFLIRDLIYSLHTYQQVPCGVVLSPTDKMSSYYKDFFPDLYIHYEINTEIFDKILKRQELMIEKRKIKFFKGKKLDVRALLVMDDCGSKKQTWVKDEKILDILMNGRHFKLTYILAMQYSLGIGPDLRGNFDYIFLLNEDFHTNKKRIYEHYAGMFEDFKIFLRVFKECVENYSCMVIDNRKPSDDISQKVFWYKGKNRSGQFTFGSKAFRKYHEKYYDVNYKKKLLNSKNTLNDICKKKNMPNIRIKKI
jgi:hypothetical protein